MEIRERLKAAQEKVKTLGAKREELVGDLRVAENQVEQSIKALADLGYPDAKKLTVEQLIKLEQQVNEELTAGLAQLEAQIVKANEVVEEYQAVANAR